MHGRRLFIIFLLMTGTMAGFKLPASGQFLQPLFIPDTLSGPVLNLSFAASSRTLLPGQPTRTFSYNGSSMPGPTLILRRGWNVEAGITNTSTDTTTFHWHGLIVPAHADGGPHSPIVPGQTWAPHFTCLNKAGTSWYHPHFHGKTGRQTLQGAVGLILVRDGEEGALSLPRRYGTDDIPLILQTLELDSQNQVRPESYRDSLVFVNGTQKAFHPVPAGWVRLRVLNASNARNFALTFSNGMSFRVIAGDGGLLPKAVERTRLLLAPGERSEIVLDLRNRAGEVFRLRNNGSFFSYGYHGGPSLIVPPGYPSQNSPLNGADYDLLELRVGEALPGPMPGFPPELVADAGPDPDAAQTERLVTFRTLTPGTAVGPFVLNDSSFRMDRIDFRIPFGNTEIWTIHNQTSIAHPFHLHGHHFYILDRFGALPDSAERGRKDVVQVGPNELLRIWVRFPYFADTTMPFMFHCHVLSHEDEGMMGQFLVVPQTSAGSRLQPLPEPRLRTGANGRMYLSDDWQGGPAVLLDLQGRRLWASDNGPVLPVLPRGWYLLRYGNRVRRLPVP